MEDFNPKSYDHLRIDPMEIIKPTPLECAFSGIKSACKFGKWKVNKRGDMLYDGFYDISHDQLKEEDWILHLSEKSWIDWNDFIPAYFQALTNADIKFITIQIKY